MAWTREAEGGEDLDVALRLRKAGWNIRFADDAICYTDVPVRRIRRWFE